MSILKKEKVKQNATKIPHDDSVNKKRSKKSKNKGDKKRSFKAESAKKSKLVADLDNTFSERKRSLRSEKKNSDKQETKGAIKLKNRNAKGNDAAVFVPWGRYVLAVASIFLMIVIVQSLPWRQWVDLGSKKVHAILQSKQRPIASVHVEGDFEYISKEQLQNLILRRVSGDFVDVDIKTIQKELAANEWIYAVAVSRIWPDGLKVKVIEQQPIALWGDRGFLNRFGEVVFTKKVDVIEHLPNLDGDIHKSDEVTQQYLNITQLLADESLIVTSLSIDDKGSWKVQLDKQFEVFVGQDSMMQKLDNFLYVYETQLKQKKEYIKLVDLRYESGMAVTWTSKKAQALLGENKQKKNDSFLSSINSRIESRQ